MKKKLSQNKFTVATVKKNINSVTIPSVTICNRGIIDPEIPLVPWYQVPVSPVVGSPWSL